MYGGFDGDGVKLGGAFERRRGWEEREGGEGERLRDRKSVV